MPTSCAYSTSTQRGRLSLASELGPLTRSSTCSSSAAASPAPEPRSTPRPAGCRSRWSRPVTSRPARRRRSSKLFHGGLRYLEQLNFGLVREALHERELMLTRIAPHLVKPVSFLYPLKHRVWERPYVAAGMTLYDSMGGARSVPRHQHFTRGGALRKVPGAASATR